VPPSGFQTFAAPAIAGKTLAGTTFSLASLRGKPAFINFWATWCPPCRREAPQLRQFTDALGKQASFVGVAIASPRTKAISFARKAGWRYPVVSRQCCSLNDLYGVVYMPTTIVLNSRGQVVDRLIGPQTAARLKAELHALGA
jgi:cytochrome c biogenesis protein CcmG, thiol:disulfide interchange protein DsbE